MGEDLRARIAEAITRCHTNGLCPAAGPCADCDCHDPQHELELAEADAVMPLVQAELARAWDEGWDAATQIGVDDIGHSGANPYAAASAAEPTVDLVQLSAGTPNSTPAYGCRRCARSVYRSSLEPDGRWVHAGTDDERCYPPAAGRHQFDPRPRWSPNVEDSPPCRHCGLPADHPVHQPAAESDQLPEDVDDLLHALWLHHCDDTTEIGQATARMLRAFRGARKAHEELSAQRDRLQDEVNRLRLEASPVHQPATSGPGFAPEPPYTHPDNNRCPHGAPWWACNEHQLATSSGDTGPWRTRPMACVGYDGNEPTDSGQTAEHGIDTAAIRAEWLRQCGSCDADLPMACSCAKGDHRPVIDRLCDALDRQQEETARLRVDRGEALDAHMEAIQQRDDARGLAAALEAELARVRDAVNIGATPALIAEILDEATDA